jgi:S-disulfanyl-L-cysteine oxidoreductase SoxD
MQRRGLVILLLMLSVWPVWAAANRARTVWDGVYSEAQAKRGETTYRQNCALCHGATLGGTENAPELAGDAFLKVWYGKSVADLAKQVQRNMPKDAPGSLSLQQTSDILAHMFAVNKFPAGADDMPATADALSEIRIEKQPK